MTTEQQLYLNEVLREYSEYVTEHCFLQQRTKNKRKINILKQCLLLSYVEIITHYFNYSISGDNNFFTILEIESIMQRINNITKSNNWIDLN